MKGPVQVVVTNNGTASPAFTAQAQPTSPSFFVFNGGPYVVAPATPAAPGDTVVLVGNGFGPTNTPVESGSTTQSGDLSPLPVIKIGAFTATVKSAALVAPGEFEFNVVIPEKLADGDQSITATYGGLSTQAGTLIPIHN
jgi:uncharacterized protein (TIGR03437 family)